MINTFYKYHPEKLTVILLFVSSTLLIAKLLNQVPTALKWKRGQLAKISAKQAKKWGSSKEDYYKLKYNIPTRVSLYFVANIIKLY